MSAALRQLAALALLCGGALLLCPEGMTARVLRLLCSAILAAAVLAPLAASGTEFFSFSDESFAELEAQIVRDGAQSQTRLRELALRENCLRYIRGRAEALGLTELRAELELAPDGNGNSVPCAVRFYGPAPAESMGELRRMIRNDLGIPPERQEWYPDE